MLWDVPEPLGVPPSLFSVLLLTSDILGLFSRRALAIFQSSKGRRQCWFVRAAPRAVIRLGALRCCWCDTSPHEGLFSLPSLELKSLSRGM